MARIGIGLALVAAVTLCGATATGAGAAARGAGDHHHGGGGGGDEHGFASATLRIADGTKVGRVVMHERDGVVEVVARGWQMPPGFHGFHIHTVGRCDPPAFTSAGGHLNPSGASHGDHSGDLPSLLVNADGRALLATATDRFTLADLRDADGSAVMVHSGRDNFANIPPRYGQLDPETLATGDAGTRLACGVVR